jgi:hypothetical protein
MINADKILVGKPELNGRNHLGDIGLDRRILLKLILMRKV